MSGVLAAPHAPTASGDLVGIDEPRAPPTDAEQPRPRGGDGRGRYAGNRNGLGLVCGLACRRILCRFRNCRFGHGVGTGCRPVRRGRNCRRRSTVVGLGRWHRRHPGHGHRRLDIDWRCRWSVDRHASRLYRDGTYLGDYAEVYGRAVARNTPDMPDPELLDRAKSEVGR